MDQSRDTLSWIFGVGPKQAKDKRLDADALKAVTGEVMQLAGVLLGADAPAAIAHAAECVATALETRVHEIALSAWNKRAEIAKYADVKKYPAGQKRYVALYEHPVTWTYRPFIQIMVGKVKCPPLEIVIDVTFKFDQAVLVIDGGRVMAMEPGKVTVEGSARIGKAKLCEPVRKELGELPGSISFGAGLPIGKDPLLRLTDAHAGAG